MLLAVPGLLCPRRSNLCLYGLSVPVLELVDGPSYRTFNLLKDLLGCIPVFLSGDFSHHLRHDHDTNIIPAQFPTTRSQPRYLNLCACEGRIKCQASPGTRPGYIIGILATYHYDVEIYGGFAWCLGVATDISAFTG